MNRPQAFLPLHITLVKSKKGDVYAYYVRGKFRKRILGELWSEVFLRNYQRIDAEFGHSSALSAPPAMGEGRPLA